MGEMDQWTVTEQKVASQLARGTLQSVRPEQLTWAQLVKVDVARFRLTVTALGDV